MTTYFDYTDDNDLVLLARDIRDEEDLESLSARAEYQVIRHYTITTVAPQGMFGTFKYVSTFTNVPEGATEIAEDQAVCLRGYAVDADDCTSVSLKVAMRHAIAHQIRWLRTRDRREADVMDESRGKGAAKQYGVNPAERVKLCDDAVNALAVFDVRPPLYTIG